MMSCSPPPTALWHALQRTHPAADPRCAQQRWRADAWEGGWLGSDAQYNGMIARGLRIVSTATIPAAALPEPVVRLSQVRVLSTGRSAGCRKCLLGAIRSERSSLFFFKSWERVIAQSEL
jgi:hypothetical protein